MLPSEEEQTKTAPLDEASCIRDFFAGVIEKNISPDAWQWLSEKAALIRQRNSKELNIAFAAIPRRTGKAQVKLSPEDIDQLRGISTKYKISHWTIDRLCRVWLLSQLNAVDKQDYVRSIETLFTGAEMNELAALYTSLPFLSYPEEWRSRCAEGIRSNIGLVLEAIICYNPYPAEYLHEKAWNQLVLKAFFTGTPVNQVIGLDERANTELAEILCDYAHERWAAGREVNPLLWRCVAPFINEKNLSDFRRIAFSENTMEREAAALACYHSNYAPAKQLLGEMPGLKEAVVSGSITWDTVAAKFYG